MLGTRGEQGRAGPSPLTSQPSVKLQLGSDWVGEVLTRSCEGWRRRLGVRAEHSKQRAALAKALRPAEAGRGTEGRKTEGETEPGRGGLGQALVAKERQLPFITRGLRVLFVCNFVSCHSPKSNKISKSRKRSSKQRDEDAPNHQLSEGCRARTRLGHSYKAGGRTDAPRRARGPGTVTRLESAQMPHAGRGAQGEVGISL